MARGDAAAALLLAQRLRDLRTTGLSGGTLTQADLARALGVSVPSISAWENTRRPTPPPARRLESYARFFCTAGSISSGRPRLLAPDQLSPQERDRAGTLLAELLDLHRSATTGARVVAAPAGRGPWHFPDGMPVTIVCAALPAYLRRGMPYANPADPDYVEMHAFADLDALVEVHGHIRAVNPGSTVHIRLAQELDSDDRLATAVERDDYTTHLVLLGGVDWNVLTRQVLEDLSLPVTQEARPEGSGYGGFGVDTPGGRRTFTPTVETDAGRPSLVEDVAMFVRAVNPFNRKRTVTICNGQFGRGTYGVVRALTDSRFRDRNAEYLAGRFGATDTTCLLTRVRVAGGLVLTPDWTIPTTVLYEWPEARA